MCSDWQAWVTSLTLGVELGFNLPLKHRDSGCRRKCPEKVRVRFPEEGQRTRGTGPLQCHGVPFGVGTSRVPPAPRRCAAPSGRGPASSRLGDARGGIGQSWLSPRGSSKEGSGVPSHVVSHKVRVSSRGAGGRSVFPFRCHQAFTSHLSCP